MFRSILHWLLYGGGRRLRRYEAACLDEVKRGLSADAAGIFDRQLERINLVQRLLRGVEVNLYDVRVKSGHGWDDADLFPNRSEELTIGRVWFRAHSERQRTQIKGDVVLCNGRVFSLTFSQCPKCLNEGFDVTKVVILADPMEATSQERMPLSLSDIQGPMGERLRRLNATSLEKPLAPIDQQRWLDAIDARLPDEYLDLISVTNGATIGPWRIHGVTEIRRVAQPNGNVYLIAEASDWRMIGLLQENDDQQLYLINPAEDNQVAVDRTLLAFVEDDLSTERSVPPE